MPIGKRKKAGAFHRNESGNATIEFVLWFPVLVAFLFFATDVTLAFMRQSHLWQVSRDTARIVSRHGMDEAEAELYAAQVGAIGGVAPTVDVVVTASDVTVQMSLPSSSITPFNTLKFAMGDELRASVTHGMEPL
jgi:Flp pilus assembly protein TadG